jgi:CO/xanthine dehydrogenase Mo-binding subunit
VKAVPPVLTTEQLAALLGISPSAVRRFNFPGVELGRGKWRYVTEDVLQFLRERAKAGGAIPRIRRSA